MARVFESIDRDARCSVVLSVIPLLGGNWVIRIRSVGRGNKVNLNLEDKRVPF